MVILNQMTQINDRIHSLDSCSWILITHKHFKISSHVGSISFMVNVLMNKILHIVQQDYDRNNRIHQSCWKYQIFKYTLIIKYNLRGILLTHSLTKKHRPKLFIIGQLLFCIGWISRHLKRHANKIATIGTTNTKECDFKPGYEFLEFLCYQRMTK